MKIQHYRFGNRYSMNIDIPPELHDAMVLKLTIQPLIENAVSHGIAHMSSGGEVNLKVWLDSDQNQLYIVVSDNGVGMDAEVIDAIHYKLENPNFYEEAEKEDSGGIGLVNTHHRIQLSYGKQYGLEITSKPSMGTTVVLKIPYIKEFKWEVKDG